MTLQNYVWRITADSCNVVNWAPREGYVHVYSGASHDGGDTQIVKGDSFIQI